MCTPAAAASPHGVGPPAKAVHKALRLPCARYSALVWGLLTIGSCGQQADARAEARALMTSLNAISDESTLTERGAAIRRLGQLELRLKAHVETRSVCSTAHTELLEAEVAQAQARRALSDITGAGPEQPLDRSQAQQVAADIERSSRALASAKDKFPDCERAMRVLLRVSR